MSHTTDVAQDYKARAVEEERTKKDITHIPPGEGARSLWVMGVLVTLKVPGHKTGGAYALFEVATPPGAGPPPHVHHREDEAFYVIEGEYEFLVGGEALRAGPGSLLYVPKGTLHANRNLGEDVGRMLVSQTPGGLFERFFEEAGQETSSRVFMAFLEDGSTEAERVAEVAARYGIEIDLLGGRARSGHPSGRTGKSTHDGGTPHPASYP